jgi:hypothetical protein
MKATGLSGETASEFHWIPAEHFSQSDAAHIGHPEIGDYQVIVVLADLLQCLPPVQPVSM